MGRSNASRSIESLSAPLLLLQLDSTYCVQTWENCGRVPSLSSFYPQTDYKLVGVKFWSMSSDQGVSLNVDSSLERRLELLESRFTTPSHAKHIQITGSSPEVATVLGSGGSPYTSQHSFGFDAPSGPSSNGSGGSNTSSFSNLDKGLVRSKKPQASRRGPECKRRG